MTPELDDDRIKELLRGDAPAAHDPVFRLSVMERRERNRFRNRTLQILAAALALAAISLIGVALGGGAFDVATVVVVATVVLVAYYVFAPHVTHIFRRFRV